MGYSKRPDSEMPVCRYLLMLPRLEALLAGSLLIALAWAPSPDLAASDDTVTVDFFEQSILPLLKTRCFECHSHESGKAKGGLVLDSRRGWEKGGHSGAAIVAGQPQSSRLLEAIRYTNPEFRMPPKAPLSEDEVRLFERWIAGGAPDPRQPVARKRDPGDLWALQPIRRIKAPASSDPEWPHDALDQFVAAKLEEAGLRPAPDADRYRWLRRVTFDLTGLPPSPSEIDDFVNDPSETAFETVVDRLLQSTAFGDHWARHWFDLSCYADLADIDGNVLIRDAWRYRDYVIAAFNSDKPLDRFIHEQIAGDLLPFESSAERRENIIATGFLAIGPWTLQNYIKGQLDADVVDHQIDRIGRVFLGQTLSCARCHDHKFDPIPTRDYYALAGIFHSTRTTSYDGPGVWSQITHVNLPQENSSPQELAKQKTTLEQLQKRRTSLQSKLNTFILEIPGASTANVLTLAREIEANEKDRDYEVRFDAGPSVWAGRSQSTTSIDGIQIDLLRADGSVLTRHRHQPGAWIAKKDAQTLRQAEFSYTGDGSGKLRLRLTTSTPGSGRFGGAIDNVAITGADGTIFQEDFNSLKPGPHRGRQADTGLEVFAGASFSGWTGTGLNHSHAVAVGPKNYAVQFFGGSAKPISAIKPTTDAEKQLHQQALAIEGELQQTDSRISEINKQRENEKALAVRDIEKPADSPVYRGGNFQSLGQVVPRGFLTAFKVGNHREIPTKSSGRLQLAHWLTDSDNPLPARILVNRVWHHLFGSGLVRSVDYFGVHGEKPSHPELLDFLALRLREEDRWSLKATVRRMVLSRTYRTSAAHNPKALAVDPENRLLWRMPRRRLNAESIRDAMLVASGELDPARGGSPLGLELKGNIRGAGGNVNPATWGGQIASYIKNRRSVYLPLKRQRPVGDLEILSAFDFPHPSEITGARAKTTVATQALFLMNSPFVKAQARKLAERLEREASDEAARLRRLYLLTASRPAAADELSSATEFLKNCVAALDAKGVREDNRRAAWVELCHAVLGSNLFLFRE